MRVACHQPNLLPPPSFFAKWKAVDALVLLDRAIDPGRRFSVIHYGRRQMLDHMFASHALYGRFRGIAIHNESLGDEVVGYSRGVEAAGSYHAALVATFDAV